MASRFGEFAICNTQRFFKQIHRITEYNQCKTRTNYADQVSLLTHTEGTICANNTTR